MYALVFFTTMFIFIGTAVTMIRDSVEMFPNDELYDEEL